ncbi:hypothetical protein HPB47_005395 [Ixodes persulcatus]|uniref:Uncharacterized protein n=1 Tax=Ixodes persulcatus TaxID=34615 RepID=A0AC60PD62_IXOPE|nr:hypothetical protein HPB47_005395 [Ixodes persulcatus]
MWSPVADVIRLLWTLLPLTLSPAVVHGADSSDVDEPPPAAPDGRLQCIVQPTRGIVLETTFLLACMEKESAGASPMVSLRLYVEDGETGAPFRGRLVHVLPGLGVYRIKLPLGDPRVGHVVKLRVEAVSTASLDGDLKKRTESVPLEHVVVVPPRQCTPLAKLLQPPPGVPAPGDLHRTLALITVAASYAEACGEPPGPAAALLLRFVEPLRLRSPLQLEHGAETLHALGFALGAGPGVEGHTALVMLAAKWSDVLRTRGLLFAAAEPRMTASVALLRALTRLHRDALKSDEPCRRNYPSSHSRALLTSIDTVQRSLAAATPPKPGSLSLQLSGYGVCIRAEPLKGTTTTLGLPNASAVTLAPASPARCLVTFSAGREPSDAELLSGPGPSWRGNRTLVPRLARGGGALFVAVRLKLEGLSSLRPSDPSSVRYRLSTALVACRSWRRPSWSGRGCAPGLATSASTLHCHCSHLSWFSGAHWVAPNEISWRKVSRGVRERDLLVGGCVLAVWVLYGVVLLWARRADQRDEVYNTVTDLQQNLPTDQQPYIVTIITGFRRNAGTTSKVWLQLVGAEGESRTFLLKDANVNPGTLQRKSEDYFLATTERALGEIAEASFPFAELVCTHGRLETQSAAVDIHYNIHARLRSHRTARWVQVVFTLEPKGPRAPWFLHTVVVQDMLEDLVWVFFVEEWLVPEEQQHRFAFTPADGHQQADFWTLFRRRLQRHFFTGHTWFNVIARYRSSKFTRAQRVTCALFVILSGMMFNVMYHDVDTSSDSEHLSLFEVPVHLNEFLLGLQVSLVTVPLGVFVVFVFSNCRPRPMSASTEHQRPRISLFSYLDNLSHNYSESRSEHRTQMLQEYARLVREGRRGLLPWWFQLVGWVVALAGSVTCSLVINVYGFSYGNKRSKEWLFRTLTGLLHNEIILEPLKVILISAFLARLIPRPPEVDDYSLRNTLTDLPDDLRP